MTFAVHYNFFKIFYSLIRLLVLFWILFKAFHMSRREVLVSSCLSAEHANAATSASAGFRFASCFGEVSLLEELLSSFLLVVLPIVAKFHSSDTEKKKKTSRHRELTLTCLTSLVARPSLCYSRFSFCHSNWNILMNIGISNNDMRVLNHCIEKTLLCFTRNVTE